MASWAEFEASDPELAAFARSRLLVGDQAIGFLATLRHDDRGPRVHPVCLTFAGDGVYVTIPQVSPKTRDLQRDHRYMLHSFPADEDAEFSMRGSARLVTDAAERSTVAAAAAFATGVGDDEDVFCLDIQRADTTTWTNWARADTRPVRRKWIAT